MGKYKNITIIRTQTNTTRGPRHTRASSAYILPTVVSFGAILWININVVVDF